jgi:uncharacterized C2H2 Zn-finger protein
MTTKIMFFVMALNCFVLATMWLVHPVWYNSHFGIIIDSLEYNKVAAAVSIAIGAIFFYRGIMYNTKDGTSFICPKCEDVFAYRDVKPLCNCPKCAVPLVPLKGYFKRKAWEERQKEKNANTNA